jgi:hypothetical protein
MVYESVKVSLLPAAALALLRLTLRSRFPDTHALVDDWFTHACYCAAGARSWRPAASPIAAWASTAPRGAT